MGKLHTLRRAILRDPKKWKYKGAVWFKYSKEWVPCFGSRAYEGFVRSVLKDREKQLLKEMRPLEVPTRKEGRTLGPVGLHKGEAV